MPDNMPSSSACKQGVIILALDPAKTTGWAIGTPGDAPIYGSTTFGSAGCSHESIFMHGLVWFSNFLKAQPGITLITMEAKLPPTFVRGKTTKHTLDVLYGLPAIFKAVARCRNVVDIREASTGDVRGHFINDRTCKRAEAKQEVMQMCRMLGWSPHDDNAGDALALWHYTCSLFEPKMALEVTPMFRSGVIDDRSLRVDRAGRARTAR
jgi:hypothetical protein